MKTQCPNCEQESTTIPDTYAGRTIRCSVCKKAFVAQPLKTVVLNEKYDPAAQSAHPVRVNTPGTVFIPFGLLSLLGLVFGLINLSVPFAAFGLFGVVICLGLTLIINRLEHIAHCLEHPQRILQMAREN